MQDPISDMFIRIKNAQAVHKNQVSMPASKFKTALTQLLMDEGYIQDFQVDQNGSHTQLTIFLKYYQNKPVISKLKRVSRPGLRIYKRASEIPKVCDGLGVAIVSTPKGVMSGRNARAIRQGGELIGIVE
jgi:small subunit ribosomal protein S8